MKAISNQERGPQVFKEAIIHYPSDDKALVQISKEIAAFRCMATIKYIESLKLNDRQIDTLYAALAAEIAARRQELPKSV